MKKQRLILSLLSIAALAYFALPRLELHGSSLGAWFSWIWLGFCLIALGGNLASLLYEPKTKNRKQGRKETKPLLGRRRERGTGI
ncbi:MAG TPA: hypothetical protein VFT51_01570 [Bacillales bacterium]|nr:hypothetical protein [Bacillales bacterium]